MQQLLITLLFIFSFLTNLEAQTLGRRALLDINSAGPESGVPGVVVQKVNSPDLISAGLKKGDRILQINDRLLKDSEDWSAARYALRAGQPTRFLVARGAQQFMLQVELPPLAYETHPGIETSYEQFTSDYGIQQRVIITKPKAPGKLPAIFLVQGLSCSSIEKYSGRSNNWVRLINDLVEKSGMIVLRVEKPGVGDSDGDCGQVDFHTELNGYEKAVEFLKSKPYVDPDKIIVFGSSMGSALAPYLANKFELAGIISEGTFYKTWYEHMLEIERRIRAIEGDSEAEILDKMNQAYIPLYHGMLVEKKSYQELITANPLLAKYNYHGPQHMYGRPMSYYHQLQDFNFAEAWQNVKVPVRIRWGTNDWIMSEFDNDMIIEVLERQGHQDHVLYKYPGLDHWSTIHPDYKSSYTFQTGKWEDKISQQVIDWAWEILRTKE